MKNIFAYDGLKNLLVVLLILVPLTSCTTSTKQIKPQGVESSLQFFKGQKPLKAQKVAYHLALINGYLLEKNNCLYISPKKNSYKNLRILFWPWNYSVKQTSKSIHILDENKKVVAKIGSHVWFGGSGKVFNQRPEFKLKKEFSVCKGSGVIGTWGVAPNFGKPMSHPSKTRKSLHKYMKK